MKAVQFETSRKAAKLQKDKFLRVRRLSSLLCVIAALREIDDSIDLQFAQASGKLPAHAQN
ncbi:MAG TPA: hypothetical protein PLD20_06895 [Blastocatellia bacterium]|nr:hypothetical protein [Blastocatellia bacterium]HMV85308.1 hypothetical protein [Blastocatellia bacterium]HMZ17636.1 hypothetical protein [Blastocatellia bacterium]HNG29301.1 hypothetical protein [Blastocatellia bacterium]